MADSRSTVEEVRSRLNILDIISEHVTLQRTGKRHKGLCPFHAEKTPSFTVSEEYQTWHCFGCGEHGDIFSFVMKLESLTFPEALERLAKRAGVEIEYTKGSKPSRKESLLNLNSLAAAYFSELLKRTPSALDYLRGRGLADQTIEQFRIGFASPAWDGLVQYLSRKGINLQEAAEVGIARRNNSGGYYDWFRNRIIFPILDVHGRVIGFGGRSLIEEEQPKYLNSPETQIFRKTQSLYGIQNARKGISNKGYAVVVEGYMDVVAAHQSGFTECMATLGTALTENHIKVISRYTNKILLAYDADSAGMKAALRGAAMFEEAKCDVRIVRLPPGEDPDSLITSGRSAEFASLIEEALPITDYKLALIKEKHDLTKSKGRAAMLKDAVEILAELGTNAEREQYIRELARYHPNFETGTTLPEDHIRKDIEAAIRRRHPKFAKGTDVKQSTPSVQTALTRAENTILRALIQGEYIQLIMESLQANDLSDTTRRKLFDVLAEKLSAKSGINVPEILNKAEHEESHLLSELAMQDDFEPITKEFLEGCINIIKNTRFRRSRTNDVIAPYIKDGIIDPKKWSSGQKAPEYEEFLKRTGKKPVADSQ